MSNPQSSPRLKHDQHWKLLRSTTSREHLIGLWPRRSKVTREIRRLAHDPKRGPGGLGTKARERAKAKLLKTSKEKRRMCLLPLRPDRMNRPGADVPVGLNLEMGPLPDVGEERMTRRWPRWWSTPWASGTTRRWITTAEGCPVSGQRARPYGVCRHRRKGIDSRTQTQTPPMDAIQTVIAVDPHLLLSRTSLHRHHRVGKRGFPIRSQRAMQMYRPCSLCPLPPVVGPRSIFSDELASARLMQPEDTLDHRVGSRAPP